MKKIILVLGIFVALVWARNYPLYKQCDPQWGSDRLGRDGTLCSVGCLVTSVAMALKGTGRDYTPKTLNNWLM